jgi:RNA polymerase sigma-70 factor (ECF subfamily)
MNAPGPGPENKLVTLYLERREALLRFFTARTGSAQEAEDVVQDIFFKIRDLDTALIENPAAYLYRLGQNVVLDRLRARRRAAARDDAFRDATTSQMGGNAVADEPSAEERLAARQRLARLISALEDLPPQCKRVFVLHKLEGMSHAAVAAELGISKSAVEKHMMSALKKLAAHRP